MEASFIFGLTLALAIGPIAIVIINQSINCGMRAGILSGAGAALADLTYALLAFTFGSFLIIHLEGNERLLQTICSLVLSAFGLSMIFSSIRRFRQEKLTKSDSVFCRRPLTTVYLMTIANPLTIIVFSGISGQLQTKNATEIIIYSLMLFAGSLVVQLILATVGAALRRYLLKPVILNSLNILSGVAIIILSISKFI